jgi:transposase
MLCDCLRLPALCGRRIDMEDTETSVCLYSRALLAKTIRQKIKADRRVKRLVNNFPYFRLTEYIKYKAEWVALRS